MNNCELYEYIIRKANDYQEQLYFAKHADKLVCGQNI